LSFMKWLGAHPFDYHQAGGSQFKFYLEDVL
jgi:hypothetical protein